MSERPREKSISAGLHGNKSYGIQNQSLSISDIKLLYSTVQYSTVQYSTVQYSTVQYSTVQYSTVQYSTVQESEDRRTTTESLLR